MRGAEAEATARQEAMRKQKDPLQELNAGQHGVGTKWHKISSKWGGVQGDQTAEVGSNRSLKHVEGSTMSFKKVSGLGWRRVADGARCHILER